MDILKVNNFGFCYRNIFTLNNIHFTIKKGEIFGIIGESGSGKTLFSHSVLRLFNDNEISNINGSIEFCGKNILKLSQKEMRNLRGKEISYIPQEPLSALNPLHTIKKQIIEMIKIHNKNLDSQTINNRFLELLNLVGLDSTFALKFPHELSGGQRQRVLIAIALANNPKIIIADEPITALDANLQIQILDLLKSLKERLNISIILITHNVNIVSKYAQNIIVLKGGSIVESGDISILSNPKSDYLKNLISSLHIPKTHLKIADSILLSVENLSVKHLSKKHMFGKNEYKQILNNINFTLHKGSILGVVGESGSGKSTLALSLIKLLDYSGDISFEGRNYKDIVDFRHFRKHIQIVFQDPFSSLNPRHRIRDIIKEGLEVHYKGKDSSHLIIDFLKCVGLDSTFAHRFPHELSGGQRQRVSIARALILNPELLILDEPTSALDKITQKQILELLLDLQIKFNLTYIFITHDLYVVRSICDKVLILKDGNIKEYGDIEILENPQNPYTKTLIESIL
ncbi:ABC transporter ATP-binding protein [Helicobacter sp. 16-1353]|uniref:nickel ABC transporter ATP-binding protein NikE n=1 Tax=Helicobacter sp. 16-1353 TaxID=2004996 RepID=UPI0015EECEFC|nr:ABC transporter ATP-binding protein [Helicobacter sp. 16-1353]